MAKKQKKNIKNKKTIIKKTKVKKRRILFGRLFLVLVILFLIIYLFFHLFQFPIKNIYIKGSKILTDQEIIEILGIQNYPSIFSKSSSEMKRKLEKNIHIKKAKVEKRYFREVRITIVDNIPLFYDNNKHKTILSDKTEINDQLSAPILMNYIPDTIYDLFLSKIQKLKRTTIKRISEIKYDPNDVDEERFLLYMSDGNYVYLTLEKFEVIDDYVNIIKKVDQKKGILYLDSGEYFKIME